MYGFPKRNLYRRCLRRLKSSCFGVSKFWCLQKPHKQTERKTLSKSSNIVKIVVVLDGWFLFYENILRFLSTRRRKKHFFISSEDSDQLQYKKRWEAGQRFSYNCLTVSSEWLMKRLVSFLLVFNRLTNRWIKRQYNR